MNSIRLNIKEFLKNIEDIESYIECLEEQKILLKHMEVNNIDLPRFDIGSMHKKYEKSLRTPVAYNAVIISIYGCFEAFVDKIAYSYLDILISKVKKYDDLPEKIRNKHIKKSGEFLSNPQRFRNFDITEKEVIKNLHKCIVEKEEILMNKALLLSHGGNLRIDQLIELFTDLGILDGKGRILSNSGYIKYLSEKNELSWDATVQYINTKNQEVDSILFEELDELIDQRNRVAHGWCVDTRISYSTLRSKTIPFMKMLGCVISDIFEEEMVEIYCRSNLLKKFDKPITVIRNKILCINSKDAKLKCGGFIYAYNSKRYMALNIIKIEYNHQEIKEINQNNIDIGIEVDSNIKKNWTYYYV